MMASFWEFPQNLAGRIVLRVTKAQYQFGYNDADVFSWNRRDGISLGRYIFVPSFADDKYIRHEYGHTVQSKYLGWFYLFVIGIPSILWAGCGKAYRKKHNASYYSFYTEKWADKLGGVERSRQ
jgi:hypothetical protein